MSSSINTVGYWACICANVSLVIIYEKIKKALIDVGQMETLIIENKKKNIEMPLLEKKINK